MPRIDFTAELHRRIKIHIAHNPAFSTTGFIHTAVREYLDRHASPQERASWVDETALDQFGQEVLAAAEKFRKAGQPFLLADLMADLGFKKSYGQAVARKAGNALRAGGYHDRRGRIAGSSPTKVWDPPDGEGTRLTRGQA